MSETPTHNPLTFWGAFDRYIETFSPNVEDRQEISRLISLHPSDHLSVTRPSSHWDKVVGVLCLVETAIVLDLDQDYDHVAPGEVALIGGTPTRRIVSFVTRQTPTHYTRLGFKGNFLPLFTEGQVEQAMIAGHRWRYLQYEGHFRKEWPRINV